MKLLLDDRYAPITSCIGFLEMEHARVAQADEVWHHDIYKPGGLMEQGWAQITKGAVVSGPQPTFDGVVPPLRVTSTPGPLARALEALPPLTAASKRRLWVPTRSGWTAYFDGSIGGTDATGPIGYLAERLQCRGLKIVAAPDSMGTTSTFDKTKRGSYGASVFELFGPESVNHSNSLRAIYALNDGGRWRWETSGAPLPFEEPAAYEARQIRKRFPFELLDRYCRSLGLRPFDEDFYLPPEAPTATLIEWVGALDPREKTFTLAEVQAGVPWFPPAGDRGNHGG